jgi:ADP-heptose:LPS heptosyltransferase
MQFGKMIRDTDAFDLFFCLPDSFSAAVMGAATGAAKRVGYKKELRQVLLTDSFNKPEGLHRADEYLRLLSLFCEKPVANADVRLQHQFAKEDHIVVNINSEASSRRLTVEKGVELLSTLRNAVSQKIVLVGAPKEKPFVDSVLEGLVNKERVENLAGATSLRALAKLLASARVVLTTDSGPAHLANALGTHTVVLFGAGDEKNTAPYNEALRSVIRLGQLSCEPCEKNVCLRYGIPQCLERLDSQKIVSTVEMHLNG